MFGIKNNMIEKIRKKLEERNADYHEETIYEKGENICISKYHDKMFDPYKSEIEKQTLTFPKKALELLIKNALESGKSQVLVEGYLDYIEDKGDGWSGSSEIIDKYEGKAEVELNLEIVGGEPNFSYKSHRRNEEVQK